MPAPTRGQVVLVVQAQIDTVGASAYGVGEVSGTLHPVLLQDRLGLGAELRQARFGNVAGGHDAIVNLGDKAIHAGRQLRAGLPDRAEGEVLGFFRL